MKNKRIAQSAFLSAPGLLASLGCAVAAGSKLSEKLLPMAKRTKQPAHTHTHFHPKSDTDTQASANTKVATDPDPRP